MGRAFSGCGMKWVVIIPFRALAASSKRRPAVTVTALITQVMPGRRKR
jgi:hypothetical protein